MGREVRLAGRRDVRPLAAALTRAFHDDPVMNYLLGPQALKRMPRMFITMSLTQFLRYRATDLLIEGRRTIGAAIWAPPDGADSGLRQLLSLPGYVWALGPQLKPAGVVMSVVREHRPREPHWYLSTIGTDPDVQGSGAGSQLIRAGLARCDRDRAPAYLESSKPKNVSFYQRFGFAVTTEFRVAADGPPVWGMWRAAER